ncbi:MAG: hypothetical protein H0V49_11945 [Nocardioidaceae bacterium]|nr:hypothetical protein [Nocardioidaceae bacterium]
MGRFVILGQCVDCGRSVGHQEFCGFCGLSQVSPTAQRLRSLLADADIALVQAREADSIARSTVAGSTLQGQGPAAPMVAEQPAWDVDPWPPPTQRPSSLPAASTPVVLLGLGAFCLLVAAIVFVSVTWSDLSVASRAMILLGVTSAVGAVAYLLLHKRLQGSAETLSLLFVALLVLDLFAARDGGLAGADRLSERGVAWLAAILLTLVSAAWALVGVRRNVLYLSGVQWTASLGLAAMGMLLFNEDLAREEYVGVALTLAFAATAYAAATAAVWRLAANAVLLALTTLCIAFVYSLRRVLDESTLAGLWQSGEAVGWLVCCALLAAVALWPKLPTPRRTLPATVSTLGFTLLALRPLEGSRFDVILAVIAAACVLFAVLSILLRDRAWRSGVTVAGTLIGLGAVPLVAPSLLVALGRLLQPSVGPWELAPTDRTEFFIENFDVPGHPMTVGLALTALILAAYALAGRRLPSLPTAGALIAPAAAVVALREPLQLWAVVSVMAALVVAHGLLGMLRPTAKNQPGGTFATVISIEVALTLVASRGSELTTMATTTALAAACAVMAVALNGVVQRNASAVGAVWSGSTTLVAALHLGQQPLDLTAACLVGIGCLTLLLAQLRAAGGHLPMRVGLEVSTVPLLALGLALAAIEDGGVLLPMSLTAGGASLLVVSLIRQDRRFLSVPGSLLLVMATWVRLADQDVFVVEAYTLPSAIVLCILGTRQMWRSPRSSSLRVLMPGLTLALLPSLLRTLPEPTSTRALLLGLGALVVLLVGARLRWIAPLLAGGAVVLVLAVLNIAPYAAALPRWVLFGTVGALLLLLGITWEKRLQSARAVSRALQRLV